jgi:hypothetical protein
MFRTVVAGILIAQEVTAMSVRFPRFTSFFATFTCLLCASALWLGSVRPAVAQATSTGTIAGVVTDQTGAVVNGATVMLTDKSTAATHSVTTNEATVRLDQYRSRDL